MFKLPSKKPTALSVLIDNVLSEMAGYDADSDEFSQINDQLEKLVNLQACNKPEKVSRDTMLIVAGNLIAVLIIVAYEQKAVISTKAQHFTVKPKHHN